jgi:hypothetical protein
MVMNPRFVKGILTSAVVALCLTLLFGAFALYGVISMAGARMSLFVAWCVAVGGMLLSDVIWQKSRRFKIVSTVAAALVFGVIAWGIDTWAVHYFRMLLRSCGKNQTRTYLLNQSIVRCQARSAAALL